MHFSLPCAALQNRLTACWCHYNYTFGQFFNIQVFSVSSPLHCSIGQGKLRSSLPRVALQISSTGQDNLYSSLPCVAVSHHHCTAAMFRAKCFPHCPELLCKTGCQHAFVIASRPLGICSTYRCAVTQVQSTAVLFRTKCTSHCPVLLCKTG